MSLCESNPEGSTYPIASPAPSAAAAHLAGIINIPTHLLPAWAGWLVAYDKPFYLIIEPNWLQSAVRDLIAIGLDQIGGYIKPSALQQLTNSQRDQLAQSYQITTPQQIAQQVLDGDVTLVDVRSQAEWDGGRLPGATHIMLGYLSERANEVMNGKPIVVQCRSGARVAIAASILQAQDAKQPINMIGGYRAWAQAGLPIER
ncbi:MAG: rhodanese-like domain-containing protein [Ardenticatenaceae bacterium]